MIDAVREPDAFQIHLQKPELIRVVRNGQILINHLQYLTDTEVILPKLVEGDIPAIERSLGQIIN